jgi:uncharacterized membrane protein (UPF0127 family)
MLLMALACSQMASTGTSGLEVTSLEISGVALEVEVASTPSSRQQGLMFRESLEQDHGMLFVYPDSAPRSFWMANTKIPLSIAFVTEGGDIVNIAHMTPFSTSATPSTAPAMYAIEMQRGWFASHEITSGVRVTGLPPRADR